MFDISSSGNYWIDSNGNMWRKIGYSKEVALRLSKTLKDCRGCIDCSYCYDCKQCEDCHYCYHCEGSTLCKFCEGCVQCSNCHHCKYCNYCCCCRRCYGCSRCDTVIAGCDCSECNGIENTTRGLVRYRWALNRITIDTGGGRVTILVDDYHNLWYQLGSKPQTAWDCFVVDFNLSGEHACRDSDAIKSDLEYIKSIGEFFHKTVKERIKTIKERIKENV